LNATNKPTEKLSAVERVRKALAEDKRTADAAIEVRDLQGGIYLEGTVESKEVLEAAEEIARSQSGVKPVINELDLGAE